MLTPAQQSALDYYLRQINLLTNEEFILEMTDHYTSAISERMLQGMTFETALTDTKQAFGGRQELQKMELHYVSEQNQAAWILFRSMLWSYFKLPRLFTTLSLLAGIYWLLITGGQKAFLALMIVNVVIYVSVGWPDWKWQPKRWKQEWITSIDTTIKNPAGIKRVIGIVFIIALNLPIWLYMFFFPFTFNRSFDHSFPVFSTIGMTASFIGFACIAELTYHRNSLLKRFT